MIHFFTIFVIISKMRRQQCFGGWLNGNSTQKMRFNSSCKAPPVCQSSKFLSSCLAFRWYWLKGTIKDKHYSLEIKTLLFIIHCKWRQWIALWFQKKIGEESQMGTAFTTHSSQCIVPTPHSKFHRLQRTPGQSKVHFFFSFSFNYQVRGTLLFLFLNYLCFHFPMHLKEHLAAFMDSTFGPPYFLGKYRY